VVSWWHGEFRRASISMGRGQHGVPSYLPSIGLYPHTQSEGTQKSESQLVSWHVISLSHPGLLFWYNIRVFRPDLVASWLNPRWDRRGWGGHSDHTLIHSNKRQNIPPTQQTNHRKSARSRSSTQLTILSNAHGPNGIHQMWSSHGLAYITHGQYTRKSEV